MKSDGDQISIAAEIELDNRLSNLPSSLWYRFPAKYEAYLSPRADGFAATSLTLAMYNGEDLEIRGPISPKLAYNLYEFRQIFHTWLPNLFQMVEIRYDQLAEPPPLKSGGGVAAAFSGGIDSFFTLWSHLPENQPILDAQITHGIFAYGLDPHVEDKESYQIAFAEYAQIFDSLGLDLISVQTNAYLFAQFRINWIYFFGQPLIGAVQMLSPFLRRFYVPSGFTYSDNVLQGSSPLTDHLLSTERLDVIHHGASTGRIDKLKTVANWPVTHHKLRVCTNKKETYGLQNCSSCDKCIRTIVTLSLLEALPKYNNFNSKISLWSYLKWGLTNSIYVTQARSTQKYSIESGKLGVAIMIQIAIWLSWFRKFAVALFKKLLTADQLYRLKRKVYQS